MPKILNSEKLFLIILTIGNIILRTFRLNFPVEPFLNEKYFILPAVRNILKGLGDTQPITPPSPLGKIIFAASLKIFGDNPFGWRIMPVLFTTASIIITYFLAKEIFKNRRVATTASLLLTFETAFFVHSRSMDPEAIFVTFVLISALFAWKFLTQNQIRYALFSGIFFGLSLGVKPQALLPLSATCALLFLFLKSKRLLAPALIFLIASVVYLAIYTPLILQKGISGFAVLHVQIYQYHTIYWPNNFYQVMSKTEYGPRMPQISTYMRYPISWLTNPRLLYYEKNIGLQKETVLYTYNPLIFFPAIAAFLLGIIYASKKKDRGVTFLIILSACSYFPYLLSSIINPLTYPPYYFLFGIPFLLINLSFFLEFLRKKSQIFYIIFLTLAAITFIVYYPLLTAVPVEKSFFSFLTGLK